MILPKLLGWELNQKDPFSLDFLVAASLAPAIILLTFFWRDWLRIAAGLLRSLQQREIRDPDGRLPFAVYGLAAGLIASAILPFR